MHSELQFTLSLDFPSFFRYLINADVVLNKIAIAERGIRCGDGWYPLIRDLATVGERANGLRVHEMANHHGCLHITTDPIINDDFNAALRVACSLAMITCDQCGMPGKRRHIQQMRDRHIQKIGGYAGWAVRCDEHAQEMATVGA